MGALKNPRHTESERDAAEAPVADQDEEGEEAAADGEVPGQHVGVQAQHLEVVFAVPHAEGVLDRAAVEVEAREVEEHEGGEDVLVEAAVVEEAQVRRQLREGQPNVM